MTLHDGKPVPKVIDFGVAKAMDQRLTERTIYTRFAQVVGTPLYMSPEQAELSGLDIDTRSDVYSLGVLLYELLTGTTPFDKQRLEKAAYDEELADHSGRGSAQAEHEDRLAGRHGHGHLAASQDRPRRSRRSVRGDLDWIVMRALEKDRLRRYESASQLAADVSRFLAREPVEARPPTLRYRLSKYLAQHKALVLSVAAVTTALLVGLLIALFALRAAYTTSNKLRDRNNELTCTQAQLTATLTDLQNANHRLTSTQLALSLTLDNLRDTSVSTRHDGGTHW